jgi:putative endopeptidase
MEDFMKDVTNMKNRWLPIVALLMLLLAALAACDMGGGGDSPFPLTPGETFDTSGMDTGVRAGDDFYRYANGRWLDTHPIQADASGRGSFTEVNDRVREQLKSIITGAAQSGGVARGSEAQKIGDFYNLFMDTARLDREGVEPVRPLLDQIEALDSGGRDYKAQLSRLIADFNRKGIVVFFNGGIYADTVDSSRYIFTLFQGGFGFEKEQYTGHPEFIDGAYLTLIEKLLEYSGLPDYQSTARAALGIQKILAASACTTEEQYYPDNRYHPVSLAELKAALPALDWDVYFEVIGLPNLARVSLATNGNGFFSAVNSVLSGDLANGGDISSLKAYLTCRVLEAADWYLSADFYAAYDDYYNALNGVEIEEEREEGAVSIIKAYLSPVLGKLYAERYFPVAYKARVRALVDNIQSAFAQRIEKLEWMSASTKTEALAKLRAMRVRIGYPDTWGSYTALTIDKEKSLWENVLAVNEFNCQYAVDTFYDPVNKDAWIYAPQTVGAFYNPPDNSINFPAAILQPPFFYPEGDDAVNYGAIGMIIGHEMTHGFDSNGRYYDLMGNWRDWWSSADAAHFDTEADKFVAWFDTLQVDGQSVNGRLTLAENIADRGGLAIAYSAWRNTLSGGEDADIDGYTGKQRFFLSSARNYAQNLRPEYQQQLLLSDEHAPNVWRVNGTLPHIAEWYEAFGITEDAALYIAPEDRIGSIW